LKTIVQSVIDKAASQLGAQEHPRGSNDGPEVRAYLASTGLGKGNPWCAAFLTWCVKQIEKSTDQDIAFPNTASCDVILAFAKTHEIRHTSPEPGDVFLVLRTPTDAVHTGFVRSVNGNKFKTIEGNSNSDGSREGNAVVSNERKVGPQFLFVRWGDLLPAEGTKPQDDQPEVKYKLFLNNRDLGEMPVSGGVARVKAETWTTALGLELGWDGDTRTVLIEGQPVPAAPLLIDGKAFLPIRALVEFSGLALTVDVAAKKVTVTRRT